MANKATKVSMVHVEATGVGFYNKLRQPGDRFDVPSNVFSKTWMKRVAKKKAPAADDGGEGNEESSEGSE